MNTYQLCTHLWSSWLDFLDCPSLSSVLGSRQRARDGDSTWGCFYKGLLLSSSWEEWGRAAFFQSLSFHTLSQPERRRHRQTQDCPSQIWPSPWLCCDPRFSVCGMSMLNQHIESGVLEIFRVLSLCIPHHIDMISQSINSFYPRLWRWGACWNCPLGLTTFFSSDFIYLLLERG